MTDRNVMIVLMFTLLITIASQCLAHRANPSRMLVQDSDEARTRLLSLFETVLKLQHHVCQPVM
jgi:hypothetical protein